MYICCTPWYFCLVWIIVHGQASIKIDVVPRHCTAALATLPLSLSPVSVYSMLHKYVKRVSCDSFSVCIRIRSNAVLSGHYVTLSNWCFIAKIDSSVLTIHKTLVTDWLTYVQHIMQPSFVGSFDVVGDMGICLQCLCHNPAVSTWWKGEQNLVERHENTQKLTALSWCQLTALFWRNSFWWWWWRRFVKSCDYHQWSGTVHTLSRNHNTLRLTKCLHKL